MISELLRFSEYYKLASLRPPTVRFPFLGEVEHSPFLAGRSYLLAANSKTGKTELIIRVVLGWPDQEILWLSEESKSIWEDRAEAFGEVVGENVLLCHAMGMSFKDIEKVVKQTEWDVLVLDTIKLLAIVDENDAAEVGRKLQPLLAVQQERGKMALFLHHTRKTGGVDGLSQAGSHAFSAAVDTTLVLSRHPKAKNQRRLHGYGRIRDPEDVVYEMEDGKLTVVQEVKPVPERLLEVLTESWQSTKELASALDPEPKDAGRALTVLAKQGRVERDPPMAKGAKKQGMTFYWRMSDA